MKIYQSKRRSKRTSTGLSKRQLFLMAGAFLVSPVFFASPVSAQATQPTETQKQETVTLKPVDASPLLLSEKENESKIQHIEENYRVQQNAVQEKLDQLEKAKQEAANASQTKLTLEEEVAKMKADIEAMKVRLAEKKALEAEQARLAAERAAAIEAANSYSAPAPRAAAPQSYSAPVRSYAYDSAGNTYGYGYCTWYVKNMRPDLPNSLGNANTWYSRAQAMGLPTGTTPRAGAVGTTTRGSLGHVVYVQSVNGDGTINISEMNYQGWNQVSYRTTSASEFVYIY